MSRWEFVLGLLFHLVHKPRVFEADGQVYGISRRRRDYDAKTRSASTTNIKDERRNDNRN